MRRFPDAGKLFQVLESRREPCRGLFEVSDNEEGRTYPSSQNCPFVIIDSILCDEIACSRTRVMSSLSIHIHIQALHCLSAPASLMHPFPSPSSPTTAPPMSHRGFFTALKGIVHVRFEMDLGDALHFEVQNSRRIHTINGVGPKGQSSIHLFFERV